ncbi:dTDP-4-dehydrorhamnose reductase [Actinokineospora globicatena]|uniref:dTDP-4-dehydrorhamnose reductase n=1 Tax=Actinokineospora globicatena TaxID=103729 RepID=A0A9W6QVK9_9PSEU|nr:dTDP-4-dehydrorhamnose reductase [Actinokineospora globicatena]GLW76247.1 NAD(P)-dependent oxidoreductase [Actinokineospora globicatena]GLW83083.1 NAD(P)-dependent oxidoreductase [Actinokineospora globicatena]GLW95362.1 NAD(P)-dependent oxidoreductase [Actinokineospora globicatena]
MSLVLLVPGGSGQLGRELAALDGVEVIAPGSAELDITSAGSVIEAVSTIAGKNAVVVNAAAYTAVDKAETDQARAFAVNADGPRVLAAVCSSRGVPLVHVSTDYVFPGDGTAPYEVDAAPGPRSIYGLTKLAGEDAVLGSGADAWVVRTSWVYGAWGKNFVKTMARLEASRDTLSVVDDQVGSPTWTYDLARGLAELASRIVAGEGPESRVLHATAADSVTWAGFARAIFEELGADPGRVKSCGTEDYPLPARRPAYSVLSNAAWVAGGLTPLRGWREALGEAFARHGDEFRG